MNRIAIIAVLALLPASAALAGSPNNPGAGGQVTSGMATSNGGVGSIASGLRQVPGVSLGTMVQSSRASLSGAPNPDNDNGQGNDPEE